jgi:hypothetical protein
MGQALKRNKTWKCPYFKWDGRREVSCEGGRIRFPDGRAAGGYMTAFCAGDYRRCTVAQALEDFYARQP